MGAWNYTYDTLNRLQAGTPTSGLYETPTAQYACFAYDSFGNRKAGALQTTACPTPETSVPSTVTYSATNQVTFVSGSLPLGLSYDGAGNVTSDGLNYYAYDGEGRLCAVENTLVDSYTQYVYDAGGTRVAKGASASLTCGAPGSNFSLTNQYLVGLGGEQVTELDGSDDWLHTNVWAGGRLLAKYDGFGIHFPLTDPLGTKRIQANAYGAVDETCFSLPYGDGLNCIGDDATEHHFTGKERDAESGNDYFGARYYASSMGRFMSPDPLPWIHWQRGDEDDQKKFGGYIMNPQNFNMYAYVLNNPLNHTDPTGMNACGTNNDSSCNVTVTIQDRSKDSNGH
jgi:RHS repeat-associated protein